MRLEGELPPGASFKDVALCVVATLGACGAVGFVIEYAGPTIEA